MFAESCLMTDRTHAIKRKEQRRRFNLIKLRGIKQGRLEAIPTTSESGNLKKLLVCRLLAGHFNLEEARPLHAAVRNGNISLVRKLCVFMKSNSISLNAANYLKQAPLHLAVITGNTEVVKLLLNSGASPLLSDHDGSSVLHLAVKMNHSSVLQVLLSSGQIKNILNAQDHEGYSALHYAVMKGYEEAVSMLHSSGANMNQKDGKSGRTPLIHAVLEKNTKMINLLLECGSCPEETDFSGKSAVDFSHQTGNKFSTTLFKKHLTERKIFSRKF